MKGLQAKGLDFTQRPSKGPKGAIEDCSMRERELSTYALESSITPAGKDGK